MTLRGRRPDPRLVIAVAGSLLYPIIVFAALPHAPAALIVALAIALAGLRLLATRGRGARRVALLGFTGISALLLALLLVEPALAAKAYPVLVSLAVAGLFGASLVWPPTLIERIARRSQPALGPEGVSYTRRLTWIWMVFLLANAAIAAALSLWGSLAAWTLWTGLLSYVLMGLLFVGEWSVRRRMLGRSGTGEQ
jgi:uncharacterized membrane protein